MAIVPKLSILTFPQNLKGNILTLNVLIIPRNIDPTKALVTGLGGGVPDAPAFVDAKLQLQAKVISDLALFPSDLVPSTAIPLSGIAMPADARKIYMAVSGQLGGVTLTTDKPPAVNPNLFIKKYLPISYRNAFNFTNPKSPKHGMVDDSYECAVRDAVYDPAFTSSGDAVSWGKVFGYLLRTPALARAAGLIQTTSITITNDMFKNGGWVYVDIAPTGDFFVQEQAAKSLIKKYAARIPALTIGKDRNIFAAVQFPVLFKNAPADPDPVPQGNFDQIFIEASEYDNGFAKIVHSFQPLNNNIMKEFEDPEAPPRKDLGIRLGWDDEQLLIWQNRQMTEDPDSPGSNLRVDSPLGVGRYRIDVRLNVPAGQPQNKWSSLSCVKPKNPLTLGAPIPTPPAFELGTEVYPTQITADKNTNYWLPSYFAQWTGRSLVLPDDEAAALFKTTLEGAKLGNIYDPVGLGDPALFYGETYDFRVRFVDHTGGGPASTDVPDADNQGPAPVSTVHFKRYIAPQPVIWPDAPINGALFAGSTLKLKRPLLGYPAVVFTNKYNDPITLLKADSDAAMSNQAANTPGRDFGLPDPDVTQVEITVEVKSLLMDNQLSASGKEAYITLYKTARNFPAAFDAELAVPVVYRDVNVLTLGDPTDLAPLGLAAGEIDTKTEIILPTSRDIRITMRCICKPDLNYFGSEISYTGLPVSFFTRQESKAEKGLFSGTGAAKELQAIYLQPDAEPLAFNASTFFKVLLGDMNASNPPDLVQRLSGQMGVENKGFTLVGRSGKHVQFGCSRFIRHSLSPDNSNITFSTKADLLNHWIVAINLVLDRDWTWDALLYDSFMVQRKMKFSNDGQIKDTDLWETVGYLRLGNAANVVALQNPDRTQSDLIFIDAVEPKPLAGNFPDTIQLQYQLVPQFNVNPDAEKPDVLSILLPVTTNPAQVPSLASAGIALSPYKTLNNYSATEAREKHLWLEFKEAPADKNDQFFIRLLNYAPDPLLCDMTPELVANTQEPILPVDPELIRVISSGNITDDEAGLDAMQLMIPSSTSDKHFIIPLPPGLHAASPELFGMFTYEIRAGHSHIWSTAQGRYGRPLRVTGVQHPAPGLFCSVNRDELKITVSAPHAMAVLNGANITSRPPKTEIWALLYAQVMQADGATHRNILLGEKFLDMIPHASTGLKEAKALASKEGVVYSVAFWLNKEIAQVLAIMGLPVDSSLSVVCVEMMPRPETYLSIPTSFANSLAKQTANQSIADYMNIKSAKVQSAVAGTGVDPLGAGLGNFRILRTSPLTAVPFVCCTDCE